MSVDGATYWVMGQQGPQAAQAPQYAAQPQAYYFSPQHQQPQYTIMQPQLMQQPSDGGMYAIQQQQPGLVWVQQPQMMQQAQVQQSAYAYAQPQFVPIQQQQRPVAPAAPQPSSRPNAMTPPQHQSATNQSNNAQPHMMSPQAFASFAAGQPLPFMQHNSMSTSFATQPALFSQMPPNAPQGAGGHKPNSSIRPAVASGKMSMTSGSNSMRGRSSGNGNSGRHAVPMTHAAEQPVAGVIHSVRPFLGPKSLGSILDTPSRLPLLDTLPPMARRRPPPVQLPIEAVA